MQALAVSFARRIAAATLAASLTFTLVPFAYADGEGSGFEGVFDSRDSEAKQVPLGVTSPQLPSDPSTEAASTSVTLSGAAEGGEAEGSSERPLTLASGLVGTPSNFINSDVALDSEPVIGSFTVDGLTYAVIDGPYVELVGVSSDRQQVMNLQEGEGSGVAPMLASGPYGTGSKATALVLPETVSYVGVSHIVSSVGAYAFYLSGISSVTLPASISNVDDRAFRSSDVASVLVAGDNPFYSSFDGALYDADQLSLLLIPEGKQGAVLLPKTAEVAEASVFSHCPLVDSISVEKGGAAFASENGLLYSSDLTTLLRVPAGAAEITIREGCATIAAGALEACAKLERINAPASVTSISPDVFTAISTVSLLAASLTGTDDPSAPGEPSSQSTVLQISATVALPSAAKDVLKADASSIEVMMPENTDSSIWQAVGFLLCPEEQHTSDSSLQAAPSYRADDIDITVTTMHGGTLYGRYNGGEYVNKELSPLSGSLGGWYEMSHGGRNAIFYVRYNETRGWHIVREHPSSVDPNRNYYEIWVDKSHAPLSLSRTETGPSLKAGERVTGRIFFRSKNVVLWDANGGACNRYRDFVAPGNVITAPVATRAGYRFLGWEAGAPEDNPSLGPEFCEGGKPTRPINSHYIFKAKWGYGLGFDVDSEPGDEDYAGESKPDQAVDAGAGPTVIEDPKRPGYVFQGWTIPNAEGTEAVDQDLVYQGDDGKWYVDASKLPDYAGDDGRVELTARWTSVISVDVPSSVTFYADVVTQGNESREGLASSAFGQSKVQSQSEVDLRVVGLESKQVKGNGTTSLGASDILKKKDGSALPTASDKLLSLYPAVGDLEEDDLKDPDRTSAKPSDAVDFSLDDVLLEKSFSADKFTIPAGDTLSLGYRLNLSETDTVLDYDKLSALLDDSTASIATISYCFAADGLTPSDWQEPLWVEDPDGAGFLLLDDIKEAALDLSAHAPDVAASSYYAAYKKLFDADASFHLLVGDAYYDVRILGIGQDTMSDGGKAGLTFEMKGAYDEQVVPSSGAWGYNGSALQKYLEEDFYGRLGARMRDEKSGIVGVTKRHQVNNTMTLQTAVYQHVFVPSFYEIFGVTRTSGGWNNAESASNSFQYQHFAKGGANVNASPYRVKKDSTGAARIWVGRSAQYDGNLRTHISGAYMDGSMSRVSSGSPSWFAPCFCL